MKVAVLGATGYSGQVLLRLLLDHPEVDVVLPVSSSSAGKVIDERDGGLGPDPGGKLPVGRRALGYGQARDEGPDAVFSALPHGVSAEFCEPFLSGSVVFDLSTDFRLVDDGVHREAYGAEPPCPGVRKGAVYGLAEWKREEIRGASLIAVPGCFPTSVLLGLLPFAGAGCFGGDGESELDSLFQGPVNIHSLTGISGAGRKAEDPYLFTERSENAVAYKHGVSHRHIWEIRQELEREMNVELKRSQNDIFFTPYLVPMRRGMLTTVTVPLGDGESGTGDISAFMGKVLEDAYADDDCIELVDSLPAVRDVVGSNRVRLYCDIVEAPGGQRQLYLFSVLDNLLKGASGQAVQDFNIRFGFPETCGLPMRGDV